jgi:hypothetical protein
MRLFPEESFKKRLGALYDLDQGIFLEEPPRVLLEGYTELKAISFSASLKGVSELLSGFQEVELLLGLEGGWSEADFYAKLVEEVEGLVPLLKKKRFDAFFLPESHTKLYLLRGPRGVRTILGSLNLSMSAWDGSQSEIAAFSEREEVYEGWLAWYEGERARAKPIPGEKERRRIEKHVLPVLLTSLSPQEVRRAVGELRGLVVMSVVSQKPALAERLRKKEEEAAMLRQLREEMKTAENALKLGGVEAYVRRVVERELERTPVLDYGKDGAWYQGVPVRELSPDPGRVEATLEALHVLLEGAGKGSPHLAEAVGEALVYGLAAGYLPSLRQEAGREGMNVEHLPAFAILAGRAGAGKTTLLKTIAALWGVPFYHYRQIETSRNTRTPTIEAHLYTEESAPLLIDEVPPRDLTEDRSLAQLLKKVGGDPGVRKTLLLTSNLEEFRSEEQILRRAWFLPFEHLPVRDKGVQDQLKRVEKDLLIRFLKEAFPTEEELRRLLWEEDPLKPARDFLLSLSLPVPKEPKGRYELHLLRRWRTFFQTQREGFREIRAPDATTGKTIPCLVVEKERAGFLVPLQPFDNGFTGNQGAYLLKKREFLEAIGEKESWWKRWKLRPEPPR